MWRPLCTRHDFPITNSIPAKTLPSKIVLHSRDTSRNLYDFLNVNAFLFPLCAGEGGQLEQSFGPNDSERYNNVGDVKQFDHRRYIQHTRGGLHTCRCRTILAAGTFQISSSFLFLFISFYWKCSPSAPYRSETGTVRAHKYFMKLNEKLIFDVFHWNLFKFIPVGLDHWWRASSTFSLFSLFRGECV